MTGRTQSQDEVLGAMSEKAASVSGNRRKEEVRKIICAGAALTPTYAVMNLLATVIACYGLLVDSTAAVIGAMVVAMLLGPIAGVGLALVDGDLPLLRKSLFAELVGVIIVMGTAFAIGLLHRDIPLGPEILARTRPGSADLSIALAGGIAATLASLSGNLSLSLVGVAVATALVPPLAACSMLLARGETKLAYGAFLLAFTNMVAIQFSSSVVFWITGHGKWKRFWFAGYRVLLHNLVSIVLLVVLGVVLGVSTTRTLSRVLFETKVRKTLQECLKKYPEAYLAEVRFDKTDNETLVRAVIRSPIHFSPQDVADLERQLPTNPNASGTALRVRMLTVEVMTGAGPLFEAGKHSQSSGH